MYSVQIFEKTLAGALDPGKEKPPTNEDELLELVGKILNKTAGQLKRNLVEQQRLPQKLLDEIKIAVGRRNRLAHDYLFNYYLNKLANPYLDPRDHVEQLKRLRAEFEDLNEKLTAWIRANEG